MNDDQLMRYSRHIMLPEIDIEGQQKLLSSHVFIVGAGGLGCPVALYLASAGTGTLTISDFDKVEASNLQRQIAHTTKDLGILKTESLKTSVGAINPDITVNTCGKLTEKELLTAISQADVVVDCSDNFPTRYCLNRLCVKTQTPLISGTAIEFRGQVSTFKPGKNNPCYQCLYPTRSDKTLSCSESGVISPLVGIIGSMQALETIKLITQTGSLLSGRLLLIDGLTMNIQTLTVNKDTECDICKNTSQL